MTSDTDPLLVTLSTGRKVDVWPNGCKSVELPKALPPAFGDTCVVCGLHPARRTRPGDVPSWTWAPLLLPTRFVPTPPACRGCATVCAASRVLGLVAVLAAMASAGTLAKMWGWSGLARLGLSLASPLAVGLLWRWLVPSWFAVGFGLAPETLAYTFRRRDVAVDFAGRNAVPSADHDAG